MAKRADVVDTGYPGIKQRISDNMYVVTLDLGRQMKPNRKTGEMRLTQVKTTKIVSTLKEAKALQGRNNKEKQYKKITGTTKKLAFSSVLEDYNRHYESGWSDSYKMQKQAQAKRMLAYFGGMDVKKIDTIHIEEFFAWCREPQPPKFPQALGNNSIQKMKAHMNSIWKFMKKNQNKYGIKENVVLDADTGRIDKYEVTILNEAQLNGMLQYAINNEKDYSVLAMIGLTGLCGLRRSELCGLSWREVDFEKRIIHVDWARVQISTGSVMKLPKGEKTRIAALPDTVATLLKYVKKQQEDYLFRAVTGDDKVFMTKTNLVNGYEPHPGKISRRFTEFQNRMNKVRGKAGLEPIPHVRLHDMRHTFISLCLNSGKVNPLQVSANCGHAVEDSTTTKVYWHDQGNREQIIDFIDGIITVNYFVLEHGID